MAVSTRSTGNELDHPEVLSRERLIEILCERCMHLQDLVDLEKGDLVQLFYKYVTPLPQRLHQLRRAKRVIPRGSPNGKESNTSKGKNTIIRLKKRKSGEVADSSGSKIARIDQSTIVEINKKPVPLDPINKGVNSVPIATTPPTLDYRTGCENMVVNKTVKAKVVKLNRKTLALNLDKSCLKDELRSSCNSGEKETCSSTTPSDSISDRMDSEVNIAKKKFEKIAVTWP